MYTGLKGNKEKNKIKWENVGSNLKFATNHAFFYLPIVTKSALKTPKLTFM